jgi:hypothetical protein
MRWKSQYNKKYETLGNHRISDATTEDGRQGRTLDKPSFQSPAPNPLNLNTLLIPKSQ